MRARLAADRAAQEPARRALLVSGPTLKDLEAAVACGCSCHPRPADLGLHAGGVSCPCQQTDSERAELLEQVLSVLRDGGTEGTVGDSSSRVLAEEVAARLGVELREIGGGAPFVVRGVVDGRGFYLRERHDLWSVVIAPDDDPLADPWVLDRSFPVIVVASGEIGALETDGVFDPVHAFVVAVDAVRLFLLRRSCNHVDAVRFCPTCGVELVRAESWRIEARREDS